MKPAKLPYLVYNWNAVELYRNLSVTQLTELAEAIRNDPASRNPGLDRGSIYLYTPRARKKLDAIAWAITYHGRPRS